MLVSVKKTLIILLSSSLFCCTIKNQDEYAGVYFNSEENCMLQLNKDSTFKLDNLPTDLLNCNFAVQKQNYTGIWKVSNDRLLLIIGKRSICDMEIIGSGSNKRIQLQTQADTNLRIDLELQKQ